MNPPNDPANQTEVDLRNDLDLYRAYPRPEPSPRSGKVLVLWGGATPFEREGDPRAPEEEGVSSRPCWGGEDRGDSSSSRRVCLEGVYEGGETGQ